MVEYSLKLAPSKEEIDAVLEVLIAHERKVLGPGAGFQEFGILLRETADGPVVGGLTGYAAHDWVFVQFLAVPESLRGRRIGSELMNRAEIWARERGLIGIWIDTFEFQARGFYEKLGYSVFGTIEDHPVGSRRYFMQKRFEAPTA